MILLYTKKIMRIGCWVWKI